MDLRSIKPNVPDDFYCGTCDVRQDYIDLVEFICKRSPHDHVHDITPFIQEQWRKRIQKIQDERDEERKEDKDLYTRTSRLVIK